MTEQIKTLVKKMSEGSPQYRLGIGDTSRISLPVLATAVATIFHYWTGGPTYLIPQYVVLMLGALYFFQNTVKKN